MKEKEKMPVYCKFLRAKNPYGTLEGGENPWQIPYESNTICWCVKSSTGFGPDNGLVSPQQCTKGRSCFAAPGKS